MFNTKEMRAFATKHKKYRTEEQCDYIDDLMTKRDLFLRTMYPTGISTTILLSYDTDVSKCEAKFQGDLTNCGVGHIQSSYYGDMIRDSAVIIAAIVGNLNHHRRFIHANLPEGYWGTHGKFLKYIGFEEVTKPAFNYNSSNMITCYILTIPGHVIPDEPEAPDEPDWDEDEDEYDR